jgi:hypothetical protein
MKGSRQFGLGVLCIAAIAHIVRSRAKKPTSRQSAPARDAPAQPGEQQQPLPAPAGAGGPPPSLLLPEESIKLAGRLCLEVEAAAEPALVPAASPDVVRTLDLLAAAVAVLLFWGRTADPSPDASAAALVLLAVLSACAVLSLRQLGCGSGLRACPAKAAAWLQVRRAGRLPLRRGAPACVQDCQRKDLRVVDSHALTHA